MSDTREEVIVCRCEGVTLSQITRAVAEGLRTPREIKGRTRAGMGICQGRTCRAPVGQLVAHLTAAAAAATSPPAPGVPAAVPPFSYRPPVRPISLAGLAAVHRGDEAPETDP